MSLTLKFLSKNDAKQHILPHVKNRFSDYSIAMAMQHHSTVSVPSHEEFSAFFQDQFLEWPQEVRQCFTQAFAEINKQLKKRAIHLSEMEIPLALTTGKEHSYCWSTYGSILNVTEMMGNDAGLVDVMHPLKAKLSNLFVLDIIKKNFIQSLVFSIFQVYIKSHPELMEALYQRLGYEKITFEDTNNLVPNRAPLHFAEQAVKLQVYLSTEKHSVDVMPIYYFNQHCKFNNKFTNVKETELQTHIDCISKGYLVIEKDENGHYHPKMKNGSPWFISKDECDDKRLFDSGSLYGVEVFYPERTLQELLADYLYHPKRLERLKASLQDCHQVFDSHFRSSSKAEEETVEANESKPLLLQYPSYQSQKILPPTQTKSNATSTTIKSAFLKNN